MKFSVKLVSKIGSDKKLFAKSFEKWQTINFTFSLSSADKGIALGLPTIKLVEIFSKK